MLEKWRDKRAALATFEDFLDRFEFYERQKKIKALSEETKIKAYSVFNKKWIQEYNLVKNDILKVRKSWPPDRRVGFFGTNLVSQDISYNEKYFPRPAFRTTGGKLLFDYICELMKTIIGLFERVNYIYYKDTITEKEAIEEAGYMGEALGRFLGAFEYGLTAPHFANIKGSWEKKIMEYVIEIKRKMMESGKSIRPKFIVRRMDKIAKEHAGKISEQQKVLIVSIAEIFAS